MSKCTQFMFDGDPEEWRPCTCPVCKGFLPAHFPLDRQFLCNKCGAVLKTYPSLDEYMSWDQFLFDVQEDRWGGRICLVPELAIKISVEMPPPRSPRRRRKKTEKWAWGGGLFGPQEKAGNYSGFSRRVWRDKDGEFIEVEGERLDITDSRIHLIVGVEE